MRGPSGSLLTLPGDFRAALLGAELAVLTPRERQLRSVKATHRDEHGQYSSASWLAAAAAAHAKTV